jgi:hypothetical protein
MYQHLKLLHIQGYYHESEAHGMEEDICKPYIWQETSTRICKGLINKKTTLFFFNLGI